MSRLEPGVRVTAIRSSGLGGDPCDGVCRRGRRLRCACDRLPQNDSSPLSYRQRPRYRSAPSRPKVDHRPVPCLPCAERLPHCISRRDTRFPLCLADDSPVSCRKCARWKTSYGYLNRRPVDASATDAVVDFHPPHNRHSEGIDQGEITAKPISQALGSIRGRCLSGVLVAARVGRLVGRCVIPHKRQAPRRTSPQPGRRRCARHADGVPCRTDG